MTWKRIVPFTISAALVIVLVLAGAAYVVVHTKAFNHFVLQKIVQEAQTRTGARVEIRSLMIHWDTLSLDLYGLTAYGKGGISEPALFRADHLRIGLKIVSLLERKINLEEIVLDRPVVDFRVNAKGETNLPISSSVSNSPASVDALFDMAIRHMAIHSGLIDYNNRAIPLSAELQNFTAQVSFSTLTGECKGSLGYDHGQIFAKELDPIEHSAHLQFTASRSSLVVDPLVLSAGQSRLAAHIKLTDYANPAMQGSYEAALSSREMERILKRSSIRAGQASAAGEFRYKAAPNQSFLQNAYTDGKVSSPQVDLRMRQAAVTAKSVLGSFVLEKGNIRVQDLGADLLGGRLEADADIFNIAGPSSGRMNAKLKSVSLLSVNDALLVTNFDRLRILGRVNADVQASWPNRIQDVVVRSHVTIFSPPQNQLTTTGIPLNGVLDFSYDGRHDTASFAPSHLQTGNTEVSMSGTLSKRSNLSVQADTSDLHEVSSLISEIQAATSSSPQAISARATFNIHGSAHFSGQVSGAVSNPSLQGRLSADDVQVEGSGWRSIRANIDLSSSGIALQNGELISGHQGQIAVNARAALDHWSFTSSNQVSIQARATNTSISDLARIGKLRYPVSGALSASFSIEGSEQSPSGHGTIQITRASAWGEPISRLAIDFQGRDHSLQSAIQLQIPAGNITSNLTYSPWSGEYDATVKSTALKLDQIHAVQARGLRLQGLLTIAANGRGTVKDPRLSANLKASQLQFRGQSVSAAEARLNVASRHMNFTLNSTVAQQNLQAKGSVDLTGEYNTTASLDARALPIGLLVAGYLPGTPTNFQGQTDIHVELSGPLKDPSRLQVHAEIPSFSLAYQSVNIALVRPLRLDYREGTAFLQESELKGTGTDLTLQGVIPIKSDRALNITANGTVDLSLLQGLTTGLKSSGRVELKLTGGGNLSHPVLRGQVRIENAFLSSNAIPVGFEGVNGQINISGNRIEIGQLTGTVGGGTISAQGSMIYGNPATFNLSLNAKSVRVRYPAGLRSVLNCNLELNGNTAASNLTGRVVVDRLSFTQDFDLANFIGQFSSETAASTASALERNMKLNVSIQSAQSLNLVNSQLTLQGAANLNLIGSMADPVVTGRVTLTGGDVFFLGKRYELKENQNSTIEFSNPVQIEPVVNLYVSTTVNQYNITLNFTGPVDRLRTTYTSDPPLPPSDIINLLAMGQTAEEAATMNTPASVGAESVVAQGVASQVSGKIQNLTGISQLTISPMAGNNQANPGAQVAIQQRITGNILLTFSTEVTSTQATTVQLQYRTSRQTTVSILRDQNGGYAIDVRLHKSF
ncbi:MAG: translocation/assembly module TamB domain-containing protein [Candidatus Acidiferrales bacterium]